MTPNQAVQCDAEHWPKYWSVQEFSQQASEVCIAFRAKCKLGITVDSSDNMYDALKFTVQDLLKSVRTYRKSSKGYHKKLLLP